MPLPRAEPSEAGPPARAASPSLSPPAPSRLRTSSRTSSSLRPRHRDRAHPARPRQGGLRRRGQRPEEPRRRPAQGPPRGREARQGRARDGDDGQAAPDAPGQEGHRVRHRRGPQPQHAGAFLDQAEQNVLRPDVLVVEPLRLLVGQGHHLAGTVCESLEHLASPGPFRAPLGRLRPPRIDRVPPYWTSATRSSILTEDPMITRPEG